MYGCSNISLIIAKNVQLLRNDEILRHFEAKMHTLRQEEKNYVTFNTEQAVTISSKLCKAAVDLVSYSGSQVLI